MQKMKPGIAILMLCGLLVAQAQQVTPDDSAAPPEEIRRYTVEMIIFEYAGSGLGGNEIFIADEVVQPADEEPDGEHVFTDIPAVEPGLTRDSKPAPGAIPLLRPLDMFLLKPDAYTMRDIYAKLQKLGAYQPIMHTAWTQTTVERDLTPPIRLRMLGDAPMRLDGSLTLYLSRYLHLVVDLSLDAHAPPGGTRGDTGGSLIFSDKPVLPPAPVRYRIFEDRIFKSGDLRYFDHPKFGVLVKVTRYEEPGQVQEPGATLLRGNPEPSGNSP